MVSLNLATAWSQDNALAAKTIDRVASDGRYVWAFADSGTSYSVIDLSQDPVGIATFLDSLPGVDDALGRTHSVLGRFHYALTDSLIKTGLIHVERQNRNHQDSLRFSHKKSDGSAALSVTHLTGLAMWRDTVFIAAGQAGWAKLPLKAEGGAPVGDALAQWQGFAVGKDSLVATLSCRFNEKACSTAPLDSVAKKFGTLETVETLAIDSTQADSVSLWLGTGHGLYRYVLGSAQVTHVSFPGVDDTASFTVRRIVVQKGGTIWAFSSGRYAVSRNGGQSFHLPPDRPGLTKVSELQGFSAVPEALLLGDTAWVNFNFDKPGLVLFRGDSVLSNEVAKGEPTELGDILLDAADSLDITREEGSLHNLTSVQTGGKTWIVIATSGKGLFYRDLHGGKAWNNISRQKVVKNGLGEVITYPTLLTAAKVNGQPEYVTVGYRLKKDGKVTITVYNYAMEKVRTVVSNAPRKGGGARSENPVEDRWDGMDSQGRPVSVGTYYIRVQSSNGDGGWGKVLAVAGRK